MASKVDAVARVRRAPGSLRLAFTRAVQDWWYGLIPFAALNMLWLLLVLTVVAGPPATAAMLGVARDAAVGEGAEAKNFFIYLRRFFWRAWAFGLITALGSLILVTDMRFYPGLMGGNSILANMGAWLMFYALVLWVECLLVAWPLMVNQPDMSIRDVMRNAAILTLRLPGANFGLTLVVAFLTVISFLLALPLSVALAALVSLIAQHYLHIQAPALANFPLRPGEGAVGPEKDE